MRFTGGKNESFKLINGKFLFHTEFSHIEALEVILQLSVSVKKVIIIWQ